MAAALVAAVLVMPGAALAAEWQFLLGGWTAHERGSEPAVQGLPVGTSRWVNGTGGCPAGRCGWNERHDALIAIYRPNDSRWGVAGGMMRDSFAYRGPVAGITYTVGTYQRDDLRVRLDGVVGAHYRQTTWRAEDVHLEGNTARVNAWSRETQWTPLAMPALTVDYRGVGFTGFAIPPLRTSGWDIPGVVGVFLSVSLGGD
ncbi:MULTISPECIES: hypothetical protein [unclassified Thioalkalivibrio]|uniref:hypothetical protein n=1 Tax=unclassified Thioalkalivibrio TaxID=2621013 RepID=UPI000360607C|nr:MULTISPECIES: hypothetical protein [unclassified Thioalkalivibrio]